MKSESMIRRVLETGHERLLSPDEVSQASLESFQPSLVETLGTGLPVPVRGTFWRGGDFWLRAKVDRGRPDARVWHGDERSGMSPMAVAASRTSGGGMPLLEVSLDGTHATRVAHELGLEVGDLVSRIARCWLLRRARGSCREERAN